jgi:DNA repair protein RecN (Recombination protein N)
MDDRALVNPNTHRQVVDAFGGLTTMVTELRDAFTRLRNLKAELAREQARLEAARGEADYLRHAFAELTELAAMRGKRIRLRSAVPP